MEQNQKRGKTRNLSVAEYFDVIQKEYIIASFRKRIYYSPKDKRYYDRVMEHKREKIEDIATRNHLDSIFTSEAKFASIRASLFDECGRPSFEFTDADRQNYYSLGNAFSYQGGIWILNCVQTDGRLVLHSESRGEEVTVNADEVIRIL